MINTHTYLIKGRVSYFFVNNKACREEVWKWVFMFVLKLILVIWEDVWKWFNSNPRCELTSFSYVFISPPLPLLSNSSLTYLLLAIVSTSSSLMLLSFRSVTSWWGSAWGLLSDIAVVLSPGKLMLMPPQSAPYVRVYSRESSVTCCTWRTMTHSAAGHTCRFAHWIDIKHTGHTCRFAHWIDIKHTGHTQLQS